jgi:hypothetical protein
MMSGEVSQNVRLTTNSSGLYATDTRDMSQQQINNHQVFGAAFGLQASSLTVVPSAAVAPRGAAFIGRVVSTPVDVRRSINSGERKAVSPKFTNAP